MTFIKENSKKHRITNQKRNLVVESVRLLDSIIGNSLKSILKANGTFAISAE